jgi:hypothetical protein
MPHYVPMHELQKPAQVFAHIHHDLWILDDAPHRPRQSLGITRFRNPATARSIDAYGYAWTEYGQGLLAVKLAGKIKILQGCTVDSTTATQKLFMLCG